MGRVDPRCILRDLVRITPALTKPGGECSILSSSVCRVRATGARFPLLPEGPREPRGESQADLAVARKGENPGRQYPHCPQQ